MSGQYAKYSANQLSWKDPVANAGALPSTGNNPGDVRIALSTDALYVWNGSSWIAIATPGASTAIDALTGDVSATGPGSVAATVNAVGGSSAANVHSAELAANAATSSNTASTIVKRDGSGSFSAGTITANLTGTASGNATGSGSANGSNTGDVTLAAVGSSPNANAASLSGQVLNLQHFDSTHPGVVLASGGGTSNFLRADGTWASPGSSGANTALSNLSSVNINTSLLSTSFPDVGSQAFPFATMWAGQMSTDLISSKSDGSPGLQVSTGQGVTQTGVSGDLDINTEGSASGFNSGLIDIHSGNATSANSGDVKLRSGTGTSRGDAYVDGKIVHLVSSDHITAANKLIKDVLDPSDPQDAATKNYVDSFVPAGPTWSTTTFGWSSPGTPPTVGTPTQDLVSYSVNGKVMTIQGVFKLGTGSANGTGQYTALVPGGYSIDTSLVDASTSSSITTGFLGSHLGQWLLSSTVTNAFYQGQVYPYDATHYGFFFYGSGAGTTTSGGNILGIGLQIDHFQFLTFTATFPIV